MSTAIAFAPTEAPRGARVAAELAYRLLRGLATLRFYLQPTSATMRAIEAGALRRYAAEVGQGGNLAFAADLQAAADRHQSRG